jgi:hypothetical protein
MSRFWPYINFQHESGGDPMQKYFFKIDYCFGSTGLNILYEYTAEVVIFKVTDYSYI